MRRDLAKRLEALSRERNDMIQTQKESFSRKRATEELEQEAREKKMAEIISFINKNVRPIFDEVCENLKAHNIDTIVQIAPGKPDHDKPDGPRASILVKSIPDQDAFQQQPKLVFDFEKLDEVMVKSRCKDDRYTNVHGEIRESFPSVSRLRFIDLNEVA